MSNAGSTDVPRVHGGPRSRNRLWIHATLMTALLGAQAVLGQQQGGDDEVERPVLEEEIVVSANRYEVPASQVGSSVTVIDAREIEQRNQVAVFDLLRTVPGS